MINIGLQPEYILSVFGVFLTNTFLTSILVTALLCVLGIIFYLKKQNHKNVFINAIRILIFELLKLTDMVTQDRKLSKKILPLITTFFLFIVTANLLALVPGFLGSFFVKTSVGEFSVLRSPNSDLTTTVALALFSVFAIQFFSLRVLGVKKYIGRFFNFTNPIKFILGFFEMISESVKVLSFSFRLFGNIFAGEVLLLIIAFLVPYIIPLPFMILEVFVGIIQAFIFAILTLTFIKTSTMRHIKSGA
ncbi:MAG TPA: F0F1 ATP synthase subunit A [Candidatus Wolfebacteria bacterium]|nr:F0F1 ATP synthase subunit A [Candidatus Wolfebacteria bacterium]